ncbi:MAG: pyruvate-flavodoxin oxidoreductase [Myxococcales bacterium]
MADRRLVTVDGNEAAASVAYRTNEVIAIYPITPASAMGELSDDWAAHGQTNIWGSVPQVSEMQSEAGAAGAVHGSLQAGALTTTFTSSQGLLLMIPNMYKIAGELSSFCMHVAARSLATHALSIFGDHSDVMACRQTGFALLCSGNVQEAQDFALVGQAASLAARVPVLHFFDGFRTSHEIARIEELTDDDLRAVIGDDAVRAHRERGLSPERPVVRGTAQNPDAFFQAREGCNPWHAAMPGHVQGAFDRLAAVVGRQYKLFEYVGHPEAERVIVMMGSGAETAHETVEALVGRGEKVGLVKVRLYRPFSVEHLVAALPRTTQTIAVLDRTKEPGSVGEPLYLDVLVGLHQAMAHGRTFERMPVVFGGRYGLSSKEFTPAMVKAVYDEAAKAHPKNGFTVGIVDDVSHTSLEVDASFDLEDADTVRAVFYGLGADGTVGANKNTIKIIGEETPQFAQGYFVYDSKKSGAVTVSHLRFGPRPIRSTYKIQRASLVAVHQWEFLAKLDVLELADQGSVLLLNAPVPREQVWGELPAEVQQGILDKGLEVWAIDAIQVAQDAGMGRHINTIMQVCFFAISKVLPRDEAIEQIKGAIRKTYAKKGDELVRRNFAAVDKTLENLYRVTPPGGVTAVWRRPPVVSDAAPDFVKRVSAVMMAGRGDLLPVSAFPVDGTWPVGTAKWEKRAIALEVPVWDSSICIQCNKCALMCPHSAIRAKIYEPAALREAPETFKSTDYKDKAHEGMRYTIQVAPEDCTGCNLCVMVCPAKDKTNPRHKAIDMTPMAPLRASEAINWEFFLGLPEVDRTTVKSDLKSSQLLQPLFEYSGACAGCGETPYIKLLTQLLGDRLLIANATGCSSIFGGNLPTTPYTTNSDGRGPAWANSLFEDNAEFGYGMRLAVDYQARLARELLKGLAAAGAVDAGLAEGLLDAVQTDEAGIRAQRGRVVALREALARGGAAEARLASVAEYLVRRSVWIVGGDGWAYDIGFGGLDHVLASSANVKVLVLDTEVYSNTGGQQSKATPLGAAAKFAVAGKSVGKKDLGMMAMSYGHVYVARVAIGAKDAQTVKAFQEAEAHDGPALIIAYSHCIAHGYDLMYGAEQQKLAVKSAVWPLFRFNPARKAAGLPPLELDSGPAAAKVTDFMRNEMRFRMVERTDPERFKWLMEEAQRMTAQRFAVYQQLAGVKWPGGEPGA